ncbi:MAG TPA: protein kinase [Polyangiales bacterium]|nr:protein kinase [Polyangiales bacterium]
MTSVVTHEAGDLIASRYRVEQVIGRGGMAIVYRVHDERFHREVALKQCSARESMQLARASLRLEREYHTLVQLAHPHIVEVYDYGVAAEIPYYTMELLSGGDLANVQGLSWQTTCQIMHDVASALALIHSRGLLHRDISNRNVHWTANGCAKLLDFGAMMSMGVGRDIVGTPPFMAPETVQLQALDGRADIYSLGALGYRLLTGRHAYPARRFSELRDAWRSRPAAPAALVPEIPAELSKLVLHALTLDRNARVRTAADLMEQLRAITSIEREDTAEISRGYLTSPLLVGRDSTLLAVRRHIIGMVRGDGGLVTIRGVAGAGRSRILDACALEGKLVGAAVLRADARDAAEGDWGVARAIAQQLIEQFPKQAAETARSSPAVLHDLFPQRANEDQRSAADSGSAPDRSRTLRELRDWVLSLTHMERVLILVDDVERADSASLALLVALGHKAVRHGLLLVLAALDDPAQRLPPALQALSSAVNTLELAELDATQTHALMRSVFNDVPNLQLCAARIHGLSHGNPRSALELAQHLVDTRLARYEAGSWVLPDALDESDLPETLAASLLARLGTLSASARELVDALALAEDDALPMSLYPTLLGGTDAKVVFQAVDELVAARILRADSERCVFAQRGFIAVLQNAMDDTRRQTLHVRMAALLTQPEQLLRRVHHLFAARLDLDALEQLEGIDLGAGIFPAAMLLQAIERATELGLPAARLHRLRIGLLMAAPYAMEHTAFERIAPTVLSQLERDSGLARYRALSHLPPNERLQRALAETQQAYQEQPVEERVCTVVEAIRELGQMSGAIMRMALPLFDLELLTRMPDLAPFYPLSPSLALLGQIMEACQEWVRGRMHRSRVLMASALTRLSAPDRAGFDLAQHERVRLSMHWMLGLFEACFGIPSAEQHLQELERMPALRVNAWRVRSLLFLSVGDTAAAARCLRRAELLQLQEGVKEQFLSANIAYELLSRSRLRDSLGVKSQLQRLAALAQHHEGWRAIELCGRARYSQLQGDLHGALELVQQGLEIAKPAEHLFFPALAAAHIALLAQLGREPEACVMARKYLAICSAEDLSAADVATAAAYALTRVGLYDEAKNVLEPRLEELDRFGCIGLVAGIVHEMRARVALAASDRPAFELHIERCTREYERAHNPELAGRVAALLEQADGRGVGPTHAAQLLRSLQPPADTTEDDGLHSRIDECLDRDERARCALTLLLQKTGRGIGYLYAAQDNHRLELIAALPDAPAEGGIASWVEQQAQAWLDRAVPLLDSEAADAESTQTQTQETLSQASESITDAFAEDSATNLFIDSEGRALEAVMLVANEVLAIVLVVEHVSTLRAYVPIATSALIAREFLARGDAKGWERRSAIRGA